ncbi:UNVERIFIED_CONTAM: hypothetical protein Sindi_1261400 [Sesamum indicum]
MCWRAGAEDSPRTFDRIMKEIKSLNEEAYDWLRRIDKAQWTLAHDGGWRTGILTTNMSECITGVLKEVPYLCRQIKEYWDPVDFELVHNPTMRARRGPGRQVSPRIPNEMDRPQVRACQQYQARQARE